MGIESLMGVFVKGDIRNKEIGNPKLDKGLTIKYSGRHRGSIRLSQGRYYTQEEWSERRKKLNNMSLP